MSGEEIHELLNELDTNHNGQVEVEEYLQVSLFFWTLCKCVSPFWTLPSRLIQDTELVLEFF